MRARTLLFVSIVLSAQLLSAQHAGGSITVAASSEPKTLNPLVAADQPSRDVIYALSADLVHVNRTTMATEPALAKSVRASRDGRVYTVVLRAGLRFSDGSPLTADDVVFTFQAHLDARANSTQRDQLLIDGKPIVVTKVSADTIRFDLPAPNAGGDRLFDGFWILPRSKLESALREGRLPQAWSMSASPSEIAGAGPFRLKQHVPGQRVVLERNPFYWKKDEAGRALPYLDRLEFSFAADANTQLLRLRAGEVDVLPRVRADDFPALASRGDLRAVDAGPSLEYNFMAFNWNATGPARAWFRNVAFRRAVAHLIDRESIAKLVYQGKATPIWSQATPGNVLWRDDKVTQYPHDVARAEALLRDAGFRRDGAGGNGAGGGVLRDPEGHPVEFTLMVSASNAARRKMATLVEDDLARAGIRAHTTPTEFASMVDMVLHAGKFEAVLWGIAGDGSPESEMNVWPLDGQLHLWNLHGKDPEPWERDVDTLMHQQMTEIAVRKRKQEYDRVQELIAANLPVEFLVSPHVLSAARAGIGGFQPGILEPVALWNCERWFK